MAAAGAHGAAGSPGATLLHAAAGSPTVPPCIGLAIPSSLPAGVGEEQHSQLEALTCDD